MERKYVIGLDYGTLSGRAIIADCKDGTVLASAVKEYDHGVMSEYLRMEQNLQVQDGLYRIQRII